MSAPIRPSQLKNQVFLRFPDPQDDTKVIQIDLIDTGKTSPDSISIYGLGMVASIPGSITSGDKLIPLEGAKGVAAAGTAESLNSFPITAVTVGTDIIHILGDWTSKIAEGDSMDIAGSFGNDGTKTVVSVTESAGETIIEFTAGDIVDATVDGNIVFAEGNFMFASIVIQGKAANTLNVYIGGKSISALVGVGITAGERAVLEAGGYPIDLSDIFIDVDVNGEGVTWTLLG